MAGSLGGGSAGLVVCRGIGQAGADCVTVDTALRGSRASALDQCTMDASLSLTTMACRWKVQQCHNARWFVLYPGSPDSPGIQP